METLFIYFGKMILCSGVMFGYYFVFLKDKTFHHYNRFYLLSILFLSVLLPLIKVDYFTVEVNPDLFLLLKNLRSVSPQNFPQNDFNIYSLVFSAFGLVSGFFILKFLFGLIKIQRLKNQFPKTEFEGINFYETPLEEAPFSFFRNLFWKNSIELQSDLGRQILKHEMVHIEQKHTWDKIILTIVNSVFWFNPVFYFIKKEIFLIHEYLADKKTVKQSDTKAFAQMLLASHFSGNSLPATSQFLSSNLKKRIIMLKKSHTKFSYLRKISALPLIFILAFAYLVNAKNREIKATNQVIAQAVSSIKKDKINIEKDTVRKDSTKSELKISFTKNSDSLKSISTNKSDLDTRKIEEISEKIAAKTNELTELKAESKDFTLKQKEISDLSKELGNVVSSADFRNEIKNASKNAKDYVNSRAFKKEIAKARSEGKKAQDYINSPAFKKQIEDAKLEAEKTKIYIDSPEFKKVVSDAQKNSINGLGKLENSDQNTSLFDDKEIKYYIDGKLSDDQSWKKVLPKNIKAINIVKIPGQKKGGSIYIVTKGESVGPNPILYNKIFINGKLSTQTELDKIKEDSIKTQNITKNNENGKTYNEIRIVTK